jgi:hypothetical protein
MKSQCYPDVYLERQRKNENASEYPGLRHFVVGCLTMLPVAMLQNFKWMGDRSIGNNLEGRSLCQIYVIHRYFPGQIKHKTESRTKNNS